MSKQKMPSINISADVKEQFDALQEQTGAKNQTELLKALLSRFDAESFFIGGVTKQQRIQLIIEELIGEFTSFTRGGGKTARANKERNKKIYNALFEDCEESGVKEQEIDCCIYLKSRAELYGMKPFYITKKSVDRIAHEIYGLRGGAKKDKDFVSNPHTFKEVIDAYKEQLNEIYKEFNESEYTELAAGKELPLDKVRLYKIG